MKGTPSKKSPARSRSTLSSVDPATLKEMISRKAYELFEKRGYQHGHHHEDWLEAERLVCSQLEPVSELGPKASPSRAPRPASNRRQVTNR